MNVSSEESGQSVSPLQKFDDSITAPSSHLHSFVVTASPAGKYLAVMNKIVLQPATFAKIHKDLNFLIVSLSLVKKKKRHIAVEN